MLPLYTEIVKYSRDINLRIEKPSEKNIGSFIGFYFKRRINNEYGYNISFHSFLVNMNSENWKQYYFI